MNQFSNVATTLSNAKCIIEMILGSYIYCYLVEKIYIYNPLYNNQPITRPDSHHVIRQYNLYFLSEKLYWTVLKRGCTHPPHATSVPVVCNCLAVEQMEVPNVANSEKSGKRR